MSELDVLKRRFERERAARKEAEHLLEEKSREVFDTNRRFRELAEHIKAVLETAAEGIITYDEHGHICSLNRSARRIFQHEEVNDLKVQQLFDVASGDDAALFDCVPEGEDVDECDLPEPTEIAGIRASGNHFIAEIAISCTMLGKDRTYTAMVRDLSRRKKLEDRLRQAQKMESVGQMAAGIAHEINTPIQFIGNNIQFLEGAFDDLGQLLSLFDKLVDAVKANAATKTAFETLLEEIESQSELADLPFLREELPGAIGQSLEGIERVSTIVRAMKEFSQPASEAKTTADVNRMVENAIAVSTNYYRDIATIETSFDRTIPAVPLVEGMINQSIFNVLANAIEAIVEAGLGGAGQIAITTKHIAPNIELQIRDNGPGIPDEIRDRIFDPFFTTKEVGKGTGQGLAFVYDVIVNKHDGAIRVSSEPNGGTTFLISLPTLTNNSSTNSARRDYADSHS